MQSDVSSMAMLGAALGLLFQVGIGIAWLVVALGPVRRANSQAGTLLAVSAALGLVLSCGARAVPFAVSQLGLGIESMVGANTLVGLLFGLVDVGLAALAIAAVAQLANAMRRDPRDPPPPR